MVVAHAGARRQRRVVALAPRRALHRALRHRRPAARRAPWRTTVAAYGDLHRARRRLVLRQRGALPGCVRRWIGSCPPRSGSGCPGGGRQAPEPPRRRPRQRATIQAVDDAGNLGRAVEVRLSAAAPDQAGKPPGRPTGRTSCSGWRLRRRRRPAVHRLPGPGLGCAGARPPAGRPGRTADVGPGQRLTIRFRPLTLFHAAGWSSQVARRAHNPKVAGSNPAPAMARRPRSGGAFVLKARWARRAVVPMWFQFAVMSPSTGRCAKLLIPCVETRSSRHDRAPNGRLIAVKHQPQGCCVRLVNGNCASTQTETCRC